MGLMGRKDVSAEELTKYNKGSDEQLRFILGEGKDYAASAENLAIGK